MQDSHLSNEKINGILVDSSSTATRTTAATTKTTDYFEIDYEDLEIYERLDRGAFGSVYRAKWKSRNKIVAVKRLLNLENEASVLSSCSHRNIIQFYGAVSQEPNYCIVTEYAEYGSLKKFIEHHRELKLNLLLKLAHDIALGMNYLHSEAPIKIIHRDLKSNNVLIKSGDDVDEYICKICDFGSSRLGTRTTKMSLTGTFPWMSPEIIQSKPANQSCDIWSYGVVLWELLTGEVPFNGIEEMQIAFLVVFKEHRLPIPNGCPTELANLMQQCWQTDPKLRPTFKQILSILDQIDLDPAHKSEIDRQYSKNKPKWEQEIEASFEKLKKIEDDLHLKEKLLEERENRLRLMEMELISTNTKLLTINDHDVNTWSENDVYEWVRNFGHNIGRYSEHFLKHNINGKRLLLMDMNSLNNIGITSVGHMIELNNEIEILKIENTRLLNFPPLKNPVAKSTPTTQRTISFYLLVGSHILAHMQKPDEYKWKMYVDIDECIIDDESNSNEMFCLQSCIRDVKFSRNNNAEQYIVHKPPFIMKHWSKGQILNNEESTAKIMCTIIYDDKVIQPRKTTIEYQLNPKQQQQQSNSSTITQLVSITLEENEQTFKHIFSEKYRTISSSTTSNVSTSTSTAIAMINANMQYQNKISSPSTPCEQVPPTPLNVFNGVENAWAKRNLENSVIIPENHCAKNSSSLWASIVKTNASKPMTKSPASSTNSSINDKTLKPNSTNATVIKKNLSHSNLIVNANNSTNTPINNIHKFGRQLSGYGRGTKVKIDNNNNNSSSYNKTGIRYNK